MCGICGIINNPDKTAVEKSRLERMCLAMEHRGPDDGGIYINTNVGLAHRRLSIIDLSAAGKQPMPNEDRTLWIVFNGEIYNFQELRASLQVQGHVFSSNTDSETILHLYEEYGEGCVNLLRGMFAFGLWDDKKKLLFLARDRVGKKPLLYAFINGTFCFASEFSSLLESGFIRKEIDQRSIHYYLHFGYIPAPMTIYKQVYKLLPAHTLTFKENKISINKYWGLDFAKKHKASEQEAADETLRLVKEAVKLRLCSDVPLGAFLSGGVDSSIIVGLMSQLSSKKVKTFSIGFKESQYNELGYARNIAEKFSTEHHEFIVRPNALEILPLLIKRYGEPYADSSCIPTYYVSLQTKKHVTVAMNGDGGDEVFAGYERYQAMLAAEKIQRLGSPLKNIIFRLAGFLPDSVNQRNRLRNIKRFILASGFPAQERYLRWIGIFSPDFLARSLYTDEFKKAVCGYEPLEIIGSYLNKRGGLDLLDSLLLTDTNTYLPNDLLVKVDIASMANSLEARSPFLDNKLMEFAAGMPSKYKIKGFQKKYLIKKAVGGFIPRENLYRRKMGFGMPVGEWLRGGLKELLFASLLSEKSLGRNYFKREAIKQMVLMHTGRKADFSFQLWSLLMLELWHNNFID